MKRLFIAFEIELNPYYTSLYEKIKKECPRDNITWTPPHLQHVTIRFIGKTPDDKIPLLQQGLEQIAQQFSPFELQVDKLGMFGSKYQPKILWLGFSDFSPLKELFKPINQLVIDIGLPEMEGNFVPHLTIGRIRMIEDKKRFIAKIPTWQPIENQCFKINSFQLIKSKLTNKGPLYTILKKYTLNSTFSEL